MVGLDDLPDELVCLILKFAALAHVERHAGWVSTLLRISRPICDIVRPILVHTVIPSSLAKLCSAAAYPHVFTDTRNLFIGPEDDSTTIASSAVRIQLAAAFHAIDGFRGPRYILQILSSDPRFKPRLVVLPPSTHAIDYLFRDISRILQRTTHFHAHLAIRFHSHMDMPDISFLRLTHVVLDLEFCYYDAPLIGIMRMFLDLPTIQMLIIRGASLTENIAPGTFEFWRQLHSSGDHRLQLDPEISHDICFDQSTKVFDSCLWSLGLSSCPARVPGH